MKGYPMTKFIFELTNKGQGMRWFTKAVNEKDAMSALNKMFPAAKDVKLINPTTTSSKGITMSHAQGARKTSLKTSKTSVAKKAEVQELIGLAKEVKEVQPVKNITEKPVAAPVKKNKDYKYGLPHLRLVLNLISGKPMTKLADIAKVIAPTRPKWNEEFLMKKSVMAVDYYRTNREMDQFVWNADKSVVTNTKFVAPVKKSKKSK